jgi:hypothetical protein
MVASASLGHSETLSESVRATWSSKFSKTLVGKENETMVRERAG